MNAFCEIAASNSLLALVLAAGIALLGRLWKNPAGLHFLWVLVLVKLITPPLLVLPAPQWTSTVPPASAKAAASRGVPAVPTAEQHSEALPDISRDAEMRPTEGQSTPPHVVAVFGTEEARVTDWPTALLWIWALGIVLLAARHGVRVVRFGRLIRSAEPAPAAVLEMADRIAGQLGLRRLPEIGMLPVRFSPLVWSLGGRPRVLLPAALFDHLGPDAQETILAHELAHVRRKDHYVRLLEAVVITLFWWHPVVWWASGRLRELEEQCCDALVLGSVAHGPGTYAAALVDTLDFLSECPLVAPAVATAARSHASVARRIRMLKSHTSVVRMTVGRLLLLSALAAIPMAVAFASTPPEPGERSRPSARKPDAKPAVQRRAVNRLVRDFPDKIDLSTPETALAAWARKLADKQIRAANELSWVKLDAHVVEDVEQSLKHDPNAPEDIRENTLNVEILQVLTYRDDLAAVICRNPGPGEKLYGRQLVGKILGIWKCFAAFDLDPEVPGMSAVRTRQEAVDSFESEKGRLWRQFVKIRNDVVNGRTPTIGKERAAPLPSAPPTKAEDPPPATAAEKEIERWRRTTWQMSIGLDAPGLSPEAVQWAIFDENPAPEFQARVKTMQSYYRQKIEGATNARGRETHRSSGMMVSWDLGFKEISGDRMHLLAAGGPRIISSNGPDGRKWIVTKSVRLKGKPTCWCFPVDVKIGESIHVWLTEDNRFDLAAAFNEVLYGGE